MKKDFSQEFERLDAMVYLIIEIGVTRQFVLFISPEDAEEYGELDGIRTLELGIHGKNTTALQVAHCLAPKGFMLNSLRQLARETRVSFSFIDETPGSERDIVAFHIQADIVDQTLIEKGEARLVSLEEYAEQFGGLLFSARVLGAGIAQLLSEKDILNQG